MLAKKLLSGAKAVEPVFVEDVFSVFTYTGNGSTQTITNGIDLAGKGGLVWGKKRSAAGDNYFTDTARGNTRVIKSNSTAAQVTNETVISGFNSNGFGITDIFSDSGATYATWTFRKAPKFFDVVTYTGDGSSNRSLSHSLGTAPGFIIIKRTDGDSNWPTAARLSNGDASFMLLNRTNEQRTTASSWFDAATFKVGTAEWPVSYPAPTGYGFSVNSTGATYVAYLFAHNAGGFGLTGTDNVISCGSFTTDGSGNATVNLGWEPQWLLIKRTDATNIWQISDVMRGMSVSSSSVYLQPQSSSAESTAAGFINAPTPTGFVASTGYSASATYIYIAIRRGPMKTPTSGTSVFSPVTYTGNGTNNRIITTTITPDVSMPDFRGGGESTRVFDRLRGNGVQVRTASDGAEGNDGDTYGVRFNSGMGQIQLGSSDSAFFNINNEPMVLWNFARAPGVYEQICYSGTGSNKTETHGLQKAPELWVVKSRSAATEWVFGSSLLSATEKIVMPSPNGRVTDATVWNSTLPTSTALSLGTSSTVNASGATFTAYMWATTAGVSKVGTYTGNGTSQTINCGFTGGARFVMILRTTASTAQDIYLWDSARGIVAGNDPRLSLNTTAAEVTTLDTIDTDSSGFIVNTDASNVNVNGAVYLYLAYA